MLYDERWGKTKPVVVLRPWQVILSLAADKLEKTGWIQGDFRDGQGGHCALGAIRAVGRNTVERYEAEVRLGGALDDMPIVAWNDHPSRTKEEVVTKLREVAGAVCYQLANRQHWHVTDG